MGIGKLCFWQNTVSELRSNAGTAVRARRKPHRGLCKREKVKLPYRVKKPLTGLYGRVRAMGDFWDNAR